MAYESYIKYLSTKLKRLEKQKFQPHQNVIVLDQLMRQIKAMMLYLKILKKKHIAKTERLIEEHEQIQQFHIKMLQMIKKEQQKSKKMDLIMPDTLQANPLFAYQYKIAIKLAAGIPKDVLYIELAAFQLELLSMMTDDNRPLYKAADLDFIFIDAPDDTLAFRFANKITAELFTERLLLKEYISIPDAEKHHGVKALFKQLQPQADVDFKAWLNDMLGFEDTVKPSTQKKLGG